MRKIAIIGAGSNFGSKLSRDILALPEFHDAELALVDPAQDRLDAVTGYVQRLIDGHHLPARVRGSVERESALDGADFVVTSISVGGWAYAGFPASAEVELPRKFGIEQSVADTIGVGGIFRFLRTAPVQLAICHDMERLCPNALLLNYTNPMCMLTSTHTLGSKITNVGLCHSVQHTAHELARYLNVPDDDVTYRCAGINHQAWYLNLNRRSTGEDLYPALRHALDDPETVKKDSVRFEMFRHFGYFVTESTVHCSEYHPYFRRTPELRAEFGLSERQVAAEPDVRKLPGPDDALPELTMSEEYAARIMQAIVADTPYRFNGNVQNNSLIDNLPPTACVEVPCLVDRQGVQPTHIGPLPLELAHLNLTNIAPQELAVKAVLDKDRDAAFHACALDPLTKSVCSLARIRALFDELWKIEKDAGLLEHWE